jgi:hypothetical protein
VSDRRGARDGEHHRRAHQEPGERDLAWGGIVPSCYLL